MSRGSVRVAAATPPVPAPLGTTAPRERLEPGSDRADQAQRVSQQPGSVLVCPPVDPPLQVTDRPRAQPRRLRQLLLRQPGLHPQLPQEPGEIRRRLIGHLTPSDPPAALPGPARHQKTCTQRKRGRKYWLSLAQYPVAHAVHAGAALATQSTALPACGSSAGQRGGIAPAPAAAPGGPVAVPFAVAGVHLRRPLPLRNADSTRHPCEPLGNPFRPIFAQRCG